MTEAATPAPRLPRSTFLRNVVWGWLGVAVNITIGLLVSPAIIRKLGIDQYGLWILLFSAIDYLRMLDFGFRAAAVNACARARAREDWEDVNRTFATALVYFVAIATACVVIAVLARGTFIDLLRVENEHRETARTLIVVIAVAVSMRLVLAPLTAVLEAFQRFDLVNRAYISALVFRATGSLAVLFAGYGLVEMALVILVAQIGENAWNFVSVKRILPEFRPRFSDVRRERLTSLFDYGRHSAVWVVANIVSLQATTTVIGVLRGPLAVGFYAVPQRLLMYSAEALVKVADVTASVSAELDESRETGRVMRLAMLTNRACLTLFMPVAIFLAAYPYELLAAWVGPEVAGTSSPLVRILLIGFLFAGAGQYNAAATLLGQGKHARYAYSLVAEVIASTTALFVVVPQYGIVGAAWVMAIVVTLNRCVYLAWLLCRVNRFPLRDYLVQIYVRPLLTAVPIVLLAFVMHGTLLPGNSWFELIPAAALIAFTYLGLALFSVATSADRRKVFGRLLRRVQTQPT
jgi:O-antigen/teichoic acid export membrane protein